MMRSMFAGISGLRSHQTLMDVVGNNIANVNTAGFKASTVTFEETLSQTIQGVGAASDARGGSNPIQIGLGTRVSAITPIFTQGASQVTGRSTDLAIQGDGFFIVEQEGNRAYTRAGNFTLDSQGNLVASDGAFVMGWLAELDGTVDINRPVEKIQLPVSQVIDPIPTSVVNIGGNIPADAAVGESQTTTLTIFDSIGNTQELAVTFTKTGDNTWDLSATVNGVAATLSSTTVTFNSDGSLASAGQVTVSGITPPGADPLNFDLDFATSSPLVQFGGAPSMAAFSQDGNAIGFLRDIQIGSDGSIVGLFSNGWTKTLAVVGTATFTNPAGLVRAGNTRFEESVNSGPALVGNPGGGGRGLLASGTLEMSNVDLATEFTNMIIAQRGFQANSRVITASDEILADLVNMKR